METEILFKYFKHNKITSFQRQLNYFGFRKYTRTQSTIATFHHPCFVQGRPSLLKYIKRRDAQTAAIADQENQTSEINVHSIEPLSAPLAPLAQEDADILFSILNGNPEVLDAEAEFNFLGLSIHWSRVYFFSSR